VSQFRRAKGVAAGIAVGYPTILGHTPEFWRIDCIMPCVYNSTAQFICHLAVIAGVPVTFEPKRRYS
jgi:hypothetical protein